MTTRQSTNEPRTKIDPVVPGSNLHRLLKLVAEAVARRLANSASTSSSEK
jgi:hypothetical protein